MRQEKVKKEEGLTFEKCKQILNRKKKYTDEQVEKIRQFLYQIAEIDYQIYQNIKKRQRAENEEKLI